MASVARQLDVGVATLYTHVRGQEELGQLAVDTVFDAWVLPPTADHWAPWLLQYARDALRMIVRYPAIRVSRPLAGGQLRHVEGVLGRLTALGMTDEDALYAYHQVALLILGVGAQIEATRLVEARAGSPFWDLFAQALASHAGELPVLRGLEGFGGLPLESAYDDLVWFTLIGIARRRGEVLSAQPPPSPSHP